MGSEMCIRDSSSSNYSNVCNEWCWNTLAKRSDIVLPCTTPLERKDIMMTPRDPYVVSMSKLVDPYGQARNDYEIFTGIAKKMGVEKKFTENRNQEEWQEWILSLIHI